MRYRGICTSVLMMAMLFASCSSTSAAGAQRIAQYYETLDAWKANVAMTVDLGEQTAQFLLAWDVSPQENRITVLAPQEIAGLSVCASQDGQTLNYEDEAIVLPRSDGTIAPMPTEALMEIAGLWKYGIREAVHEEKDGEETFVCIDYGSADGEVPITVSSKFHLPSMAPVTAEVYYDGVRMITCTFESFAPQESTAPGV